MKLFLFDDRKSDDWHPFSLSRPCAELLFGRWLLRERLERFAGTDAAGTLTRSWLADFTEAGAPPALPRRAEPARRERVFLCTRAVPPAASRLREAAGKAWAEERLLVLGMAGEVVGCRIPAGADPPDSDWFVEPGVLSGAAEVELPGDVLGPVWELVSRNPDRLSADLEANLEADPDASETASDLPRGVERIGNGEVHLGRGVRIEPGVLLDVREGSIELDAGVEVRAGTRLTAPLYAGRDSRLLGGSLSVLAAGPRSHLRGEVEESVVLGYVNKAHDGFLGHSYLGRWVNLGALTTNSDLKNNYGPVRLGGPGGDSDTGLLKLGCLLGDHVKTAIGTLLNTGTMVGAGSNLFGARMPPKWVPPFTWGGDDPASAVRKEAFLTTARTVLGRRGVAGDAATLGWLADVWDHARGAEAYRAARTAGRRAKERAPGSAPRP